jgi:hypothetical protein
MANFAQLAAEAKARRLAAEAEANGQTNTDGSGESKTGAAQSESVSESAPESTELPSAPTPSEGQGERPKNRFGTRKDSGPTDNSAQSGGESPASSGVDSSSSEPRSKLAAFSSKPKSQSASDDSSSVAPAAITSLDDLDQSTDEGIAPREGVSRFADETPADKPTRELPEGLTKEALGFVDMIDGVYEVMHDAELLGSVIRSIMLELKSNPEYMKLVAPDDIRAWVRGMRESMGLAKIRKQEAKAKRSGGGGKKSKLIDSDMLADLESLGVDIPE